MVLMNEYSVVRDPQEYAQHVSAQIQQMLLSIPVFICLDHASGLSCLRTQVLGIISLG